MPAITASMVAELRAKTDAPMMECKKALAEAAGDMGKAEEILRVKLGNKAGKAAARITAEGVVAAAVEGTTGALIEINCETDFVSKNDSFLAFAKAAAELVDSDWYKSTFIPDVQQRGAAFGGEGRTRRHILGRHEARAFGAAGQARRFGQRGLAVDRPAARVEGGAHRCGLGGGVAHLQQHERMTAQFHARIMGGRLISSRPCHVRKATSCSSSPTPPCVATCSKG